MTCTYTATVDVDTAENFEFVCTTLLTTLCAAGFPSQHSLKVHFPGIFLRKNSQNPVQYVCTWVLMLYCVNLQCKPGCVCYRILVYTKPMDSVFHALWLTCSSSGYPTLLYTKPVNSVFCAFWLTYSSSGYPTLLYTKPVNSAFRALWLTYSSSGYPTLLYTRPVNSVFRTLWLASQAQDILC